MPNQSSEKLKRNRDKIIAAWMERALKEIGASVHQTTLALGNSLDGFLDQIAEALAANPQKTEAQANVDREQFFEFARSHGESRAGMKNYTIEGLIREYHILRQTICDVLEEEAPLSAREREIITSIIEQAVNDAASEYARILREIREKFTATLVHDLRNPIAAAMMNAQMTLRKPADADFCVGNANRILDRLTHVSAMIDDVLDASKLSAGENLSLPFQECDLGELLEAVVADYAHQQPGRVLLIVKEEIKGYWNPRALRRIVDNLLTNALKYGAPDAPVTISAGASGREVTITVHNHGLAISAKDLSLIFQQFKRAKSAESEPGWGLGLVVVKGLTEAHGGKVRVESTAETGTKFLVILPRDSREGELEPSMKNAG